MIFRGVACAKEKPRLTSSAACFGLDRAVIERGADCSAVGNAIGEDPV
jgi:hypothetical protein